MLFKAFSAADLNNDGFLTESELQMFLDKQAQQNGQPEFNYEIFQILMKKLD
jgi:Ca2+-binding EF-hand superfamily protein